jgi:DNA topoisomerase IA
MSTRELANIAAAGLLATAACVGHVRSDVDSINSELTGPYAVRHIVEGKTFVADVCVASRARRALVAEQIIDQRLSHGHDAIIVNLYSDDGREGERVTWRPGEGSKTTPLGPSALCAGAT